MNSRRYLSAKTMPALYHDSPDERRKRAFRRTPRGKESFDSRPPSHAVVSKLIHMYVHSCHRTLVSLGRERARPLTKTTTESLIRECEKMMCGQRRKHITRCNRPWRNQCVREALRAVVLSPAIKRFHTQFMHDVYP